MTLGLDGRRARKDGRIHAVEVLERLVPVAGASVHLEALVGRSVLPVGVLDVDLLLGVGQPLQRFNAIPYSRRATARRKLA